MRSKNTMLRHFQLNILKYILQHKIKYIFLIFLLILALTWWCRDWLYSYQI